MKRTLLHLPITLTLAILKINRLKSLHLLTAFLVIISLLGSVQSQTRKTNLPHSMKGYELYSWQIQGEWYFSLLVGTNRLKTLNEIVTAPEVSIKGVPALKRKLSELPRGEEVIWSAYLVPQTPFPPERIISEIKDYCNQNGIILRVAEAPRGKGNEDAASRRREKSYQSSKDDMPGNIRLLPGYSHKAEQGIDTRVGRIWKDNGLLIRYDIGKLAGQYINPAEQTNFIWFKEQVLSSGQRVRLAMTKEQQLIITFPDISANFYADVKSSEDISDMLLIVLTYTPEQH